MTALLIRNFCITFMKKYFLYFSFSIESIITYFIKRKIDSCKKNLLTYVQKLFDAVANNSSIPLRVIQKEFLFVCQGVFMHNCQGVVALDNNKFDLINLTSDFLHTKIYKIP